MKVLFIEPCHVNFGGYFRARNICDGLNSHGHTIDLLVATDKKFFFSIKKHTINSKYHIYELPKSYFHNFLQGRFIRAIIAIFFALINKYDIYHIAMPTSPESTIPAIFLKLIGKKNIVLDWDEIFENGAIKNNYLMHSYAKWIEYNFPKIFSHHTVVSQILHDTLQKRGAINILKIINAVNPNQFRRLPSHLGFKKSRYDPNFTYLTCFANTFYGDRGTKLLKTLKIIYKLNPKIKLITNFSPQEICQLNRLKLSLEFQKNIIGVGLIPPKKLGLYMSVAKGSIFYMANTIQDRSGFPVRVGSSINGHLPVFTNDNNSEVSRVLKQNKCAVLGKSPQDLALKTVNTLKSKKYLTLKKNTIQASKKLSVKSQTKPLISFYHKLLSSTQ